MLCLGCDSPKTPGTTQEALERNVAWVSQNRAEYRREGAKQRRELMHAQLRTLTPEQIKANSDVVDAWIARHDALYGIKKAKDLSLALDYLDIGPDAKYKTFEDFLKEHK